MSGPSFVILPVSGHGTQQGNQETAEIASTVQDALHKRTNPQPEQPGPFKQILAHQDSLYKYINWEDPTRTLTLYAGALSILFGVHYLPLTQVALKAGVIGLGVVSVTEFASRSFGASSLSTRLRPKEYKMIPESTLNATLKDIHDFVQYVIVQVQKIAFGQDLDKTFAGFIGFTALYWLIKVVSPFWLTVMGLTSIFLAPLGFSPQGRNAAHDASVRVQELTNTTVDRSKVFSQNGTANAEKSAGATVERSRVFPQNDTADAEKQATSDLSAQAGATAFNVSGTRTDNGERKQTYLNTYSSFPQ